MWETDRVQMRGFLLKAEAFSVWSVFIYEEILSFGQKTAGFILVKPKSSTSKAKNAMICSDKFLTCKVQTKIYLIWGFINKG